MKLTRKENWPDALNAYIEQRRCMPFAWGVHDCCQFARRGIQAVCVKDPGHGLGLYRYRTAKAAIRLLQKMGGIEAIPARVGLVEIRPAMAQRADLVVYDDIEGSTALGIVCGAQAAFPAPDGLVFVPTLKCRRAWRVG